MCCIFCSYQLAVVGKLISFMTEDNGIDTFLMYCMEQITNIVVSGGDTVCDEELVLTTMLNVLKVQGKICVYAMYLFWNYHS